MEKACAMLAIGVGSSFKRRGSTLLFAGLALAIPWNHPFFQERFSSTNSSERSLMKSALGRIWDWVHVGGLPWRLLLRSAAMAVAGSLPFAIEAAAPADDGLVIRMERQVFRGDAGHGYLGNIVIGLQAVDGDGAFRIEEQRFVPRINLGTDIDLANPLGDFPQTHLPVPIDHPGIELQLYAAELDTPELVLLRLVLKNTAASPLRISAVNLFSIDPERGGLWMSGLMQDQSRVLSLPVLGDQGGLAPATNSARASNVQLLWEGSTGRSTLIGFLTQEEGLGALEYTPDPSGRGIASLRADLLYRPARTVAPGEVFVSEVLFIDRTRLDPRSKLARFARLMAVYQGFKCPAGEATLTWQPTPISLSAMDIEGFSDILDTLRREYGCHAIHFPQHEEDAGIVPERRGDYFSAARDAGFDWEVTEDFFARKAGSGDEYPTLQPNALAMLNWAAPGIEVLDPTDPAVIERAFDLGLRLADAGAGVINLDGIQRLAMARDYQDRQGRTGIWHARQALRALSSKWKTAAKFRTIGLDPMLYGMTGHTRVTDQWITGWTENDDGTGAAFLPVLRGLLHDWYLFGVMWTHQLGPVFSSGWSDAQWRSLLTAVWFSGSGLEIAGLPDGNGISPEQSNALLHVLPLSGQVAAPLDLLENDPPRIWHLPIRGRNLDSELVAFFGWPADAPEADSMSLGVSLPTLRLPRGQGVAYHLYEFWTDQYLGMTSDIVSLDVPRDDVRVVKVSRVLNRPQLLASNRHLSMGFSDILSVEWNPSSRVLFGRQKFTRGIPTHLVFYLPANYRLQRFHLAGRDMKVIEREQIVEVTIPEEVEGELYWELVTSMRSGEETGGLSDETGLPLFLPN
jgi:hypothetical protein